MTQPMDRTAERQRLDDAIRSADSADRYLTDLERQRERLPELQREQRRCELEAAATEGLKRARADARALLDEAAAELTGCRHGFTEISALVRLLSERMHAAQGKVYAAIDLLTEPTRAAVSMLFFDDARAGTHAGDRDIYLALLSAFADEWAGLGGERPGLEAFPPSRNREEHALVDVVGRAARCGPGRPIYHPGYADHFNPFKTYD